MISWGGVTTAANRGSNNELHRADITTNDAQSRGKRKIAQYTLVAKV